MDGARADRLYKKADAGRWNLPMDVFVDALERGVEKAFAGRDPSDSDRDRYYDSLHLADLALSCACALGNDAAWEHFVREFRPALYRSADAIDPGGGAREIADAIYAELFGLRERDGIRQSVFRYFHGRSSLATWLRSLIAQRFVDRHREQKRVAPLPEDTSTVPLRAQSPEIDLDRRRYVAALRASLAAAIAVLAPKDRLRLACYYAQEMTLAQIARLTREHEATVSRHLARTRKAIRGDVERRLREEHGFAPAQIDACFASIIDDAGNLDLAEWLDAGRKESMDVRSIRKDQS